MKTELYILSLGGGTNSAAMAIELVNRKMPIDYVIFSDTGGERPETYEFVKIFSDWLVSKDYPAVVTVSYVTKDGAPLTLEQDCLNNETLPPPCYGGKSCSQKFKISVLDKFVKTLPEAKELWKNGGKVTKYIGYDAGEPGRREGAMLYDVVDRKFKGSYPLIDDWNMGRKECIEVIEAAGLPLPGKSSCFFCPNMKKHEIKSLYKKHPELIARALKIEEIGLKNVYSETIKGLGRNYSWKDYVDYINQPVFKNQIGFCAAFDGEDDENGMPCGCYDG